MQTYLESEAQRVCGCPNIRQADRNKWSGPVCPQVLSHVPEDLAMAALAMDTLEVLDACEGEAWIHVQFKAQMASVPWYTVGERVYSRNHLGFTRS